jgi:translation initiation factor IF-1
MEILQKIIGDLCNGDIIYIEFIPFDKKKEQIERAFK